ncbi:MAG: FAD-dependent oxidoreductase [Pseudonocardiaceae bacterium]
MSWFIGWRYGRSVVLVVGGGIAGAAVALALNKAGIDVTVREAHPESSGDGGAFLTLGDGRALTTDI